MELSLNRSNDKTSSFTDDDIKEKYQNLKIRFDGMSKKYECIQQELHDLKRNHNTAVELKDHLYSEIEAMQKNEKDIKTECNQKCKRLQEELDLIREEKWKESESFTNTIETLEQQIKVLKQANSVSKQEDKEISNLDQTKLLDDMRNYELEIESLKESNVTLKTSLEKYTNLNEVQKAEVESLKERIECLESNLSNKKEEIESISDMLHSTQEELCSANMQLQQFKSSSTTMAPKGNSLFAEVDDKRQEMLKTLSQMKEKVCQLNRELASKQAEVDALMCEKKTLWEEFSGQSKHNDATLFRAYERRITDLEKQIYQLNRDIARWFDKHIDPHSSESAQWVSGVLEHYRKENSKLSGELMAASVNNLSAEQKSRDLQRQIVTWRTKALQANASVSELEAKLQTLEKSMVIVNSTQIETPPHPQADCSVLTSRNIKPSAGVCGVTPKKEFNDVDISAVMKENKPPNVLSGILSAPGGDVKKVPKVTSFKQES